MNQFFESILKFHKKHRVLTHILFWVTILFWGSLFEYFNEKNENHSLPKILLIDFLNNFAKIPTAYFVVYFLFPRVFDEKKFVSSFLFFIVGGYIFYIIISIIRIKVFPLIDITFVEADPIKSLFSNPKGFYQFFFLKNLGGGASMLLIKMLINHNEVQQKALTLEKQKAEIELKLLKTQLNPHFLFNTLNNIYTLSLLNSPKTSESIARLSDILDYILYRCNGKTVRLSSEISLLENYIALEKLRYDERLRLNIIKNIEKDTEIAPLILVSLVENAFKHGASEDMGSPQINIEIEANDQNLKFMIENSISSTKPTNSGLGLENLRHQLELIYEKKHTLEIRQNATFFKVNLLIEMR